MRGKRILHRFAYGGIELKRCSKCKRWLVVDQFTKNKSKWDGKQDACRRCLKEYRQKEKARILKAYFRKDSTCIVCGENHPAALVWHHRNSITKTNSITFMIIRGFSEQLIW